MEFVGTTSTILTFLIDNTVVGTFTDIYRSTALANMTHVGIGAYGGGGTNFTSNYFANNIEIDTIPSQASPPEISMNADITISDTLTVRDVVQETARDGYGQISSGFASYTIPLTAVYKPLNTTNIPTLTFNKFTSASINAFGLGFGFQILDAGLYRITANISTKPSDDGAIVHFTLFTDTTSSGGSVVETDFQSICEKVKTRMVNQTIDAIVDLPAGSLLTLQMKSVGVDQVTTVQFISMNIVRMKDSTHV